MKMIGKLARWGMVLLWLPLSAAGDVSSCEDVAVRRPRDLAALYNVGVAAWQAGRLAEARGAFSCAKLLAAEQQVDARHGEQLFYNAGNLEMKTGAYADAEKSFERVLSFNPSNEKAQQKRDLARRLKDEKKDEKKEQKKEGEEEKREEQKNEQQQQEQHGGQAQQQGQKSDSAGRQKQEQEQSGKQPDSSQHERDNKREGTTQNRSSQGQKGGAGQSQPQHGEKQQQNQDGAEEKRPAGENAGLAQAKEEKKAEKVADWGGAGKALTGQEAALLQQVGQVDRANVQQWTRMQMAQGGGDDAQNNW